MASEEEVRPVMARFVPVAFVKVRLVMVPVVALSVPTVAVLAFKVETVPLVAMRFANVPVVAETVEAVRAVTPRVVMVPFVANKFVVVTDVAVTEPRFAFQRLVADPREKARSVVGMRSELTVPETTSVEETERFDVEAPPYKDTRFVVCAPASVTVWRFGVDVAGHPTPFCRQIAVPLTVAVVKAALKA
jgi:hypothetical protein